LQTESFFGAKVKKSVFDWMEVYSRLCSASLQCSPRLVAGFQRGRYMVV